MILNEGSGVGAPGRSFMSSDIVQLIDPGTIISLQRLEENLSQRAHVVERHQVESFRRWTFEGDTFLKRECS